MTAPTFRCPECKQSDGLYELVMVPGWRSVDDKLAECGGRHDRDVDWLSPQGMREYGCSCGYANGHEIGVDGLEQVGIDGEPLVPVHPDQLAIGGAS